jgi:diguanylate cyclase (GGDEF)-like protein
VLDAVADAVIELGYDGANLALVDPTGDGFRPMHARGVAQAFGEMSLRGGGGVTGKVLRTRQPVVLEDYPTSPLALEALASSGVRSTIAVPVFRGGDVVAVLYATSLTRRAIPDEEVEAMRILATTAGTALENAQEFLAQLTSARTHAAAALTDSLTGVGNRRYAEQLLADLTPGDSVVMIDLDRFKGVNDRLGHAAGDEVLRALATHLLAGLREDDRVARFGGEEFLVVLRGVTPTRAARTVERLLASWRATEPVTTFSAGIAHHSEGSSAEQTLERADQALYAAKDAGRDTWRTDTSAPRLPRPRRVEVPDPTP